jgi:hypothetical protein
MSRPEPARPDGPDAGRPDRPLGRGLEDVSHLFLSQQADPGNLDPRGPWAGRPLPREEVPPSPIVLRPAAQVTREQVGAVLRECPAALEPGLRIVDAGIPCAPCGEIDLLAVDRASQLAILDFDTTAGDELLVRGLGHVDWAVRNVPNLRRMLRGQAINFSLPPRLFLLAPRFSSRVLWAGRQIARPQLEWVRYHLVEGPGPAGILFEPVAAE